MKNNIPIYQVDAFTDKLFSGNPAAVCLLESWLDEDVMQSIAAENNLAETAFVVPVGQDYEIRWFTPTVEVDLCGHATLAAAFVLFELLHHQSSLVQFHSPRSGLLAVEKRGDMLFLDFPTDTLSELDAEQNAALERSLGVMLLETYKGKTDYLAVVESENILRNLKPDLQEIRRLTGRGLIVTAKGESTDFVSRFFAPQSGIDEDPVTGSAHTSLLPLWSKKLGKTQMIAAQLSKRGGQIWGEFREERCLIGGKARLYFQGELFVD